jgi:uncharacterized protein YfkK (UPF0435 family)
MKPLCALSLILLTGCASQGDLGSLQRQVNAVEKVANHERKDNVALQNKVIEFTNHLAVFETKVRAEVEAEKDRATMTQSMILGLQQKLDAQNVALVASQAQQAADAEARVALEAALAQARKDVEHMQTVVDVALLKLAKSEQDLTRMLAQVSNDRERLHVRFNASTAEMQTLAQALARTSELQTTALQTYLRKGQVAAK